jgi:hypothetical protein
VWGIFTLSPIFSDNMFSIAFGRDYDAHGKAFEPKPSPPLLRYISDLSHFRSITSAILHLSGDAGRHMECFLGASLLSLVRSADDCGCDHAGACVEFLGRDKGSEEGTKPKRGQGIAATYL